MFTHSRENSSRSGLCCPAQSKILSLSLLLSCRAVDIQREVNGVRSKGTYPCSCACKHLLLCLPPALLPFIPSYIRPFSPKALSCTLCGASAAQSTLCLGRDWVSVSQRNPSFLAFGLLISPVDGLVAHYFQIAPLCNGSHFNQASHLTLCCRKVRWKSIKQSCFSFFPSQLQTFSQRDGL